MEYDGATKSLIFNFWMHFFSCNNQQSSLTFRNLQQSANAKLVVVSLQCRKEQGGTDIKATAGRRK